MPQSFSSSSSTSSLLSHPTNRTYIRSGIGGAGNYHLADQVLPPTSILPSVTIPRNSGHFSSGIGGAGNIHHASERAVLSSNEELVRARVRRRKVSAAYHVGIGGAGNRCRSRQCSSSECSSSSFESAPSLDNGGRLATASGADRLMWKLSQPFKRKRQSIELTELSRDADVNRGRQQCRHHDSSFFGKVFSSHWLP